MEWLDEKLKTKGLSWESFGREEKEMELYHRRLRKSYKDLRDKNNKYLLLEKFEQEIFKEEGSIRIVDMHLFAENLGLSKFLDEKEKWTLEYLRITGRFIDREEKYDFYVENDNKKELSKEIINKIKEFDMPLALEVEMKLMFSEEEARKIVVERLQNVLETMERYITVQNSYKDLQKEIDGWIKEEFERILKEV